MDILPTILDLAQILLPGSTFRGREVVPVKGKSWVPYLSRRASHIHGKDHVTGWEVCLHQAIRKGKWKAIFTPTPAGPEKWQLYNMDLDRTEMHDLAEQHPEVLSELTKYWLAYVSDCGAFL